MLLISSAVKSRRPTSTLNVLPLNQRTVPSICLPEELDTIPCIICVTPNSLWACWSRIYRTSITVPAGIATPNMSEGKGEFGLDSLGSRRFSGELFIIGIITHPTMGYSTVTLKQIPRIVCGYGGQGRPH